MKKALYCPWPRIVRLEGGSYLRPVIAPSTIELLRHLAGKPGHDEVKADFRQLLIEEFGAALSDLGFERYVLIESGRLDALIGRTIFEAKRDLIKEWQDVERKMPDYLAACEKNEGEKFVGIASDGHQWTACELDAGKLIKIKETLLDPDEPELFLAWLDGVVALRASLPPEPLTIRAELGQNSLAFRRSSAALASLWSKLASSPQVVLKRQLWAQLLELVYGREIESDALWFQHTFLVVAAKCIALAVLGLREDDPKRLLSGEAFQSAGISGAVESDFFDWVVADSEGEALVRRIMNHVRRFRLNEVESDVLKVLYESLIDREQRHGLGEYYTPDWLAAKMVRHVIDRPLVEHVLDPACGSGTFLFHAIRVFLREAEEAGMNPEDRASRVCARVGGMDIHPVAVIIARVTYLLALAPALQHRKGALSIPVYLGDAMQLSISEIIGGKELTIRVPPPPAGEGASGTRDANGREQLDFPDTFCRDPALFDKAIERMRGGSETGMTRAQIEAALFRITEQHYRADVTNEQKLAIKDLGKTYLTFDKLRREGRDSVWAYVARNLSRPLAFSSAGGWASIVVGNPPWVAYRHMSTDLQKRFKELAKGENVYVGGKLATQNDLCALFAVRAASLYLRSGGTLAFVLPLAALSRGQFERLRSGSFMSARIAWDEVWTMDDRVQPLFPVPCCVVFGRRRATSKPFPGKVRAYSGTLPFRDAPEEIADQRLKVRKGAPALDIAIFEGGSPYRTMFRQGATLVPRMLCFVERRTMGRIGADPSAPYVASRRTNQEKLPWKNLPGIESRVESEFLRPVLLGESILLYRVFKPLEAVVPITGKGEVLDAEAAANRGFDGLHGWMKKAEKVWNADRPSPISFVQQLDYYGKLASHFPLASLRVVYSKAGMQPAACLLRDATYVIDHKLYWSVPANEVEAHYLTALLNSETARQRGESLQSRGQWGARDFDKVIFNLPIPRFAPEDPLHNAIAEAAREAETIATSVPLPESVKFQRVRGLVRAALTESGVAQMIDALVARLLDRV
ncbi:MAG: N-6 DNA methylase [Methylocella sp.]